jgi:sulfate/thiosulfate transport system substrate-binding protein
MAMVTRIFSGVAALALAAALAGCAGTVSADSGASNGPVTLSLVAYSTPQTAYEALIKAFQATPEGKNVKFTQSYGGSGDQSRAVAAGLKADIVAFSLEPDITRLVTAKLVAPDWNADATKGMVTDSVVVIATRKGNPKGIRTWDDLVKPGVQVITPNPFASGGARWNLLAGYGAKSNKGADKAAGLTYLEALLRNVPVQDTSARASLQTFAGGKGDAIISYENEAIFAQQHSQALDYTVPDDTILIENPIAVTANSAHPAQAKAFLAFLHSAQGQKIFADNGYRPVGQTVPGANFPTPAGLFTLKDLGGWSKVSKEFFDPSTGSVAAIEQKLGVSTASGGGAPSPSRK